MELIALVFFAQYIGKVVRAKGYKPWPYILMTVGMWIFGEALGAWNAIILFGAKPFKLEGGPAWLGMGLKIGLIYLFMLLLAAAAALAAKTIAKNLRPVGSTEAIKKMDIWWLLVLAADLILLILASVQPDPFQRIVTFVLDGLWVTIYVTLISFVLVLFFGLLAGLARLSRIGIVRSLATIYVEVIRGIPILVQLMFWYFAFPAILKSLGAAWGWAILADYKANPLVMAILGLTVAYSAYMSEVYRAGIQSIAKGQMEAARSLGMTYFQAMRYIILPQAVRVILPPVGNEFITLLKDSSLVSVVAVADMTRRGREFQASNFMPIEPWIIVGLLYLMMTLFSARVVTWLEHKTRLER